MCMSLLRLGMLLLFLQITLSYTIPNKLLELCVIEQGCNCSFRVRKIVERECCCTGDSVTDLSQINDPKFKTLTRLLIRGTDIKSLTDDAFDRFPLLEYLYIHTAPLTHFNYDSLRNQTLMKELWINNCSSLTSIEGTMLLPHRFLKKIYLQFNSIKSLPAMESADPNSAVLAEVVDMSYNHIEVIPTRRIRSAGIKALKISHNRLKRIEADAFVNCKVEKIEMVHNPDLTTISPQAFADMTLLHNLDLSHTSITSLPSIGMQNVTELTLQAVETLKQLPTVLAFTSLTKAVFTYPHHCCLFKHVSKLDFLGNENREHRKRICKRRLDAEKVDRLKESTTSTSTTTTSTMTTTTSSRSARRRRDVFEDLTQLEQFFGDNVNFSMDGELPPSQTYLTFEKDEIGASPCEEGEEIEKISELYERVVCTPLPDAMNPCESIVGFPWLRYTIWFVWISSVILNVIVWIILAMAYETRKRAHYIFMFNLSFANALSAIYLGLLAVEDQRTNEEYFRFAVGWQTGVWCKAAGFLCVFSSSLSILSMFFIAFEIAYSTRQAIFGRHLSFRTCMACVVFSYVFSFVMAVMPLVGVSDYSTTSTCLPLYIENHVDRVYIIFGLSILIAAFVGMVGCYGSIFRILMDPNTPSRPEDHHIIMKMLALIITDMLCWMPSCILGLNAALADEPIIDISTAKIFIICFFPLNTFTNPFLYVFLTKVIRSKVKKRAVPIFKRLVSTPRHTLHSLSVLYHMHGPEDRRRKSNDSSKFNSCNQLSSPHPAYQDTATTRSSWLNGEAASSPRGSGESAALLAEGPAGWDRNRRRSTPRVSFQSTDTGLGPELECFPHQAHHHKEKTPGRFSSILKKVSAIPEVSDLSEHSSDSHHEHVITMHRNPRLLHDKRAHTISGCTHDSGRSSLASIFARGSDADESSAASECSELLSPLSIETAVPSDDDESTVPHHDQFTVVSESKIVIGLTNA